MVARTWQLQALKLRGCSMTCRYYIGLDPGKSTGYAVWDSEKKEFLTIETLTFWKAVSEVESLNNYRMIETGGKEWVSVVIEDPAQNKPTFFRPGTTQRQMQKISQNVGANKEHGRLLIERFESLGLQVKRVRPSNKTQTKLTAATFKRITGYSGRTSEHGRDAAMLVFGM